MNDRRMIFLWFVLSAPLAAMAAGPPPAEVAVRELGRAWLADNDGVGLTIGVYDSGKRSFYNFGATQLDGNKPPTKDTVYEIGSVGKTMTGQLLARAVVEGRAALTDEAAKYLDEPYPNLASGGEPVRLVHLANMTAQLADNIPDLTQVRLVPGEPLATTRMRVIEAYTRVEFLRQLHRVVPQRAPGSDPAHSNVASMLLGVVLEKLYGDTFDVILAREIEKPLKMASGTAPVAKLLAQGYTNANEALPTFSARMQVAAGSLRYSADDFLKYAAWQLAERDASVKLAHRATWFTLDRRQSIAFYWIMGESPQGRRLHYSGGTFGFTSVCELYPDARVAVVLLSNKASDGAQETLRALSGKIVALVRPAGSLSPQPSSGGVPQPDR
jgi:D-alanyl-D-alanine-carboxypeptidase/D-alanyl-D-alanine-endopeptidase